MIDFELGIKENSGMDAAGLGDLCKLSRIVKDEANEQCSKEPSDEIY
jgi:hypothetical protein